MKKNYKFLLLSIVAFVISSCSSSSSDYLSVIPSDVEGVISVNVGSLLEKSGIMEQQDVLNMVLEAVESESSREVSSLVGDLLENINNSGIDFSSPIYSMSISEFEDEPIFVAKVDKKSNLLKMIEVLHGEQICSEVMQAPTGDYDYFLLDSEQIIVAFNSKSIIVLSIPYDSDCSDTLESIIDPLMAQSVSQSIVGQPAFKKLLSQKFDIGGLVNGDGFTRAARLSGMDIDILSLDDLSSVSAYGGWSFEKGDIVAKAEIVIDDAKVAKQYSELTGFLGKIDGKHLQYIPQTATFLSVIMVDGGKLVELIEAQDDFDDFFGADLIKGVANNISGDITLAMMDMDQYIAYVSIKSEAEAIEMIEQQNKDLRLGLEQSGQGQYNLNLGRGANFYFGVDNGAIYLNTESDSANQKAKESMADMKYKTDVKGKNVFLCFSPNSKFIKDQFSRELRRNPELAELLEQVSHVELSIEDALLYEFHASLNNSSENSLRVITNSLTQTGMSLLR